MRLIGDDMVLEIEFYKGDHILQGKRIKYKELKEQVDEIERKYDREQDNFVELLCRRYGWTEVKEISESPAYRYDRDIKKLTVCK